MSLMEKRYKATSRTLRAREDEETLKGGKYPKGVRMFKASPNQPQLTEPWSESKDAEKHVVFTVRRGATRAEAQEALYLQYNHQAKLIDLEALVATEAALIESTSFAKFCNEIEACVNAAISKSNEYAEKLGVEKRRKCIFPTDLLDAVCNDMWETILRKAHVKVVEAEEKETKTKEKRDIRRSSPLEAPVSPKEGDDGERTFSDEAIQVLIDLWQQNDHSPGEPGAQSSESKTKKIKKRSGE